MGVALPEQPYIYTQFTEQLLAGCGRPCEFMFAVELLYNTLLVVAPVNVIYILYYGLLKQGRMLVVSILAKHSL